MSRSPEDADDAIDSLIKSVAGKMRDIHLTVHQLAVIVEKGTGPKGEKGEPGERGKQGPKGDKGDKGEPGNT